MKDLTHDQVNNMLSSYVTTERMPYGWRGTTLSLLEYSTFPLDARVCAALMAEEDNRAVMKVFADWCRQELSKISENEYAKKGLQYAAKWSSKGAMPILATYMRRAYYDHSYNATKNLARAISASNGCATKQALRLYALLRDSNKGE